MPCGTHLVVSSSLKSEVCCQSLRPEESVVIWWLPSLKTSATDTFLPAAVKILEREATLALSACSVSLKSEPVFSFAVVEQSLGSEASERVAAARAKIADANLMFGYQPERGKELKPLGCLPLGISTWQPAPPYMCFHTLLTFHFGLVLPFKTLPLMVIDPRYPQPPHDVELSCGVRNSPRGRFSASYLLF